jgi:ketosteroid isomerase-like protein
MTTLANTVETVEDDRTRARRALEQVCARGDFEAAETLYSPEFIDHVNDLEFRGHEGIRQSVGLYRSVFDDLRIHVDHQVMEGDRVVSRWTAEGSNRGRPIRLRGITISRFVDGQIMEDWTLSDNLSLLRQLGPWRAALVGIGQLAAYARRLFGR